jgi:hypothetical protein
MFITGLSLENRRGRRMKYLIILMLLILIGCGGDSDYGFYTNHGMEVTVGAKNNPGPALVELWTDQTIDFWRDLYPHWLQCMNNNTSLVHVSFIDEDFLIFKDEKYAGLAYRKSLIIEISYRENIKIVRNIFIHELSHVFVGNCLGTWNTNSSHAIFKEVGLNSY